MRDFVTVVSGMPRSGTSMTMRMLQAGGLPVLTDGVRQADEHNPHGYFEYEPVKNLVQDSSWMCEARGKAIKVIYRLLPHLPDSLNYRVIFMERRLDDVVDSQTDMLRAYGDATAHQQRRRMIELLTAELRSTRETVAGRPEMRILDVSYAGVLDEPQLWAARMAAFVGGEMNAKAMAEAVDIGLSRHRKRS